MSTVKPLYSSNGTITISPASLASSSTFVAGRESNEVDNTTTRYEDAFVMGKITVGTTPTANTFINIFVWGSDTSLATTPIDVLDGVDSAETITNTGVLLGGLRAGPSIPVLAATSDVAYPIPEFSVAKALGLPCLPKFWGIFIAHSTVAALHATAGNHVVSWYGVNGEIVA